MKEGLNANSTNSVSGKHVKQTKYTEKEHINIPGVKKIKEYRKCE